MPLLNAKSASEIGRVNGPCTVHLCQDIFRASLILVKKVGSLLETGRLPNFLKKTVRDVAKCLTR
jgi:hypothetical protein